MHCPEDVDGSTYLELVTAVSVALARNLDAKSTFLLAEFAQAVSSQMITLAIFKEAEERRRAEEKRRAAEAAKKAAEAAKKPPPKKAPPFYGNTV